jgi:trigger factor
MNLKSTEKKEKSQVELVIEVTKEEFEEALTAAYRKNVKNITIPGFRKGKAPRRMIERMYGRSFFWEDAVNESYQAAYQAALKESGTEPVGRAEMEILDISEDGYSFRATVPVKPEVRISDYKGIEAGKAAVTVEPAEVDAEIERLRKRNARIESVEREARHGDTVVIDYEGFVDGVPFEGGKAEHHNLELGSGMFIPGFEDSLIGVKAGEERDIDVTFPEDYYAEELAGKNAVFKVRVHEVKETILPELDDEFAKDVSEFDTVDELRADIEKNIREEREKMAQSAFENAVFEQLIEKLEADIPDAMIDSRIDSMVEDFSYRLASQGIEIGKYLKITGTNEETLRETYRPQAERLVRLDLSLEKIAELENLEVGAEEIGEEYNRLAEQYNMDVDRVKILLAEDQLKKDLLLRKASGLVMENAVAKETEPISEEETEQGEATTPEDTAVTEEKTAGDDTAAPERKEAQEETKIPDETAGPDNAKWKV